MDNRRKKVIKASVLESIEKLVAKSRVVYKKGEKAKSKRYVDMAFDLLKKNKVKLPKELKNSFCRKCHLVFIPNDTVKVVYDPKNHCLRIKCKCGHSKRL